MTATVSLNSTNLLVFVFTARYELSPDIPVNLKPQSLKESLAHSVPPCLIKRHAMKLMGHRSCGAQHSETQHYKRWTPRPLYRPLPPRSGPSGENIPHVMALWITSPQCLMGNYKRFGSLGSWRWRQDIVGSTMALAVRYRHLIFRRDIPVVLINSNVRTYNIQSNTNQLMMIIKRYILRYYSHLRVSAPIIVLSIVYIASLRK